MRTLTPLSLLALMSALALGCDDEGGADEASTPAADAAEADGASTPMDAAPDPDAEPDPDAHTPDARSPDAQPDAEHDPDADSDAQPDVEPDPDAGAVEPGPYPSGPYGLEVGDVIEDLVFEQGEGLWRLSDARDEGARLLMIITSAGWCPSCVQEQPKIQQMAERHAAAGLRPIVAIYQDADFAPADGPYAAEWRAHHQMTIPIVADPEFTLSPYFNPGGRSMFLLVEAETMIIRRVSRDFHSTRSEQEAVEMLEGL